MASATGLLDRINNEIANHEDGKPAGYPDQGELASQRGDLRRALPGLPGRRGRWTCGCEGSARFGLAYPGLSLNIRVMEHPGPVPGTQPAFFGSRTTVSRPSAWALRTSCTATWIGGWRFSPPSRSRHTSPRSATCFFIAFDKGTASWELEPDGSWTPHTADPDDQPLLDMQEYLISANVGAVPSEYPVPGLTLPETAKERNSQTRPILAGGAVVTSEDPVRGIEVLIVHRMRYNDWTLPKGKLDAGESLPACATREVLEETGVTIRLGVPLDTIRYDTANGVKQVEYWGGTVLETVPRPPDDEVDIVSWLKVRTALDGFT